MCTNQIGLTVFLACYFQISFRITVWKTSAISFHYIFEVAKNLLWNSFEILGFHDSEKYDCGLLELAFIVPERSPKIW
jgi:hypothetical protein